MFSITKSVMLPGCTSHAFSTCRKKFLNYGYNFFKLQPLLSSVVNESLHCGNWRMVIKNLTAVIEQAFDKDFLFIFILHIYNFNIILPGHHNALIRAVQCINIKDHIIQPNRDTMVTFYYTYIISNIKNKFIVQLLFYLSLSGRAGPLPIKAINCLVPWGTEAIPRMRCSMPNGLEQKER